MKKKSICWLLALAICMSFCESAAAVDENRVSVLRDNEQVRVAQASYGDTTYVATYDKESEVLTLERVSASSNIVESKISVDANECVAHNNDVSIFAATDSRTTSSLFSYTVTYSTPRGWSLKRPSYNGTSTGTYSFACDQRDSNKADLYAYQDAVNSLYSAEQTLMAVVGEKAFLTGMTAAFAAVVGGPVGFGAAVSASVAAVSGSSDIVEYSAAIENYQSQALRYYEDVRDDWLTTLSIPDAYLVA